MEWRAVAGFEGQYEVSDTGLIRSLDRTIETRNGSRWKPGEPGTPGIRRLKGKLLKPGTLLPSGHQHVVLTGRVDRTVHRMVLEAFVGPCPSGLMALHNDDDPTNNTLSNLSWGTRSDNSHDAVRNGRHWQVNKTHCSKRGHPLIGDNIKRDALGNRHCRECARIANRDYLARQRAARQT